MFAALLAFSCEVNAQSLKFGHINSGDLLNVMPQMDSMQVKLDAFAKDLGEIQEEMVVEYNRKLDEFSKNQDKWSEVVKESKQNELLAIQRRLQEQQQNAQQQYQAEQQKLFQPVLELVRTTIAKVAKANGLTYVFDVAGGTLLYFNEAQSTDVLPLVKKELNITK